MSGRPQLLEASGANTLSLHRKLAEVMAEADRIPKNGTYSGQGSFKYVLVGDAADAIRKALGERGVSMLPTSVEIVGESEHETRSGGTMTTLSIRTTWTLTDADTGETAVIQSLGTGADSGDKASPKAQTNAMKYALLMGFLLSTGDDPEQSDTSDRGRPTRTAAGPAVETETLIGETTRTGKIARGEGHGSDLEYRQSPDGHSLHFRLEIPGKNDDGSTKNIPQVWAEGEIGETMYAVGLDPEKLLGEKAVCTGLVYGVSYPGRRTYHRMRLSRIVVGDAIIPPLPGATEGAATSAPGEPERPAEAESQPLGLLS